jgi:hypothetical protein
MVFDRSLLGFLWEIVSRFLCVSMIWNPCRPLVGQGQWHGMGPQLNSGAQVSLAYWTHSWWQHSQLQIDRCPGGHVRDPTIRVVSDKVVTAPRSHSLSSQLSDLLFWVGEFTRNVQDKHKRYHLTVTKQSRNSFRLLQMLCFRKLSLHAYQL